MSTKTKQAKDGKTNLDGYDVKLLDDQDQIGDCTVISDDVIAVITYMAVQEIPGVIAAGGGLVGDIAEKFGKRSLDRGIKVQTKGENVIIEVSIFVEYGVKIPEMAIQIQHNVRKHVEEMAGKKVVAINLIIQGVKLPNTDSKDILDA
ncbi:MAG: Asp23/Gls24 family envelope stress response protein [Candidatus Auribacterota bacterium]|jgi:uncharacterized alkaline shock family protein YloU|nr:Asp23/Gls24 family envelope stress response protein [Candidatus Auribacterota bacterium]